ncbi:MAG: capsular polysaccharide biosynthesis protein [Sandaracinaceae bacterium]
MTGYVDLHAHYLPGVDDGVRTVEESQRLLTGLRALGYTEVVATPHIRTAMFENRKPGLERSFAELCGILDAGAVPALSLAAEHFCDDVFFGLLQRQEHLPYRGGHAILLEFRYEAWPRHVEDHLFRMQIKGLRPVIAHPERYHALFDRTDPLDPLLEVGAVTLLDTMSLTGKYGERPRRAAERMLEEGAYDAACSDAHRPEDVDVLAKAIVRLERLVGKAEAEALLGERPRAILEGTYEP